MRHRRTLRANDESAHTTPAAEGLESGLVDEAVADLADVGEDLIPMDGVAAVERATHENAELPAPRVRVQAGAGRV